jgi:hypothetical protein
MSALIIPHLLVWSSIATLNGVRGKINCSQNTAIVSILTIKNAIITMMMATMTVIVVLRDDLNWTPAKNTPQYGAKG